MKIFGGGSQKEYGRDEYKEQGCTRKRMKGSGYLHFLHIQRPKRMVKGMFESNGQVRRRSVRNHKAMKLCIILPKNTICKTFTIKINSRATRCPVPCRQLDFDSKFCRLIFRPLCSAHSFKQPGRYPWNSNRRHKA